MATRTEPQLSTIERELIEVVYPQVLGEPGQVGPDQDFFGLGGDSIELMRLVALAQEHFAIDIEIKDFIVNPTARCLAGLVERAGAVGMP